jgi:hypothetical protein
LLGHAAYAQTLVLAIFLGGMAIGAAGAARRTTGLARPLLAYAAIEATIGLSALAFHPVFIGATGGFFDVAFAQHPEGISFAVGKWGLATLLILPQSILLGATFPAFAAAAESEGRNGQARRVVPRGGEACRQPFRPPRGRANNAAPRRDGAQRHDRRGSGLAHRGIAAHRRRIVHL